MSRNGFSLVLLVMTIPLFSLEYFSVFVQDDLFSEKELVRNSIQAAESFNGMVLWFLVQTVLLVLMTLLLTKRNERPGWPFVPFIFATCLNMICAVYALDWCRYFYNTPHLDKSYGMYYHIGICVLLFLYALSLWKPYAESGAFYAKFKQQE